MYFPTLNSWSVDSLSFLPSLLWIILGVVTLGFLSLSGVLFYHWIHYSLSAKKMTFVIFAYSIVSLFLLITATTAVAYFQIIN